MLGGFAPEARTRQLFRDRFIGAVRPHHPLLGARVTPERYAAGRHVVASRKGSFVGLVDDALATLGLRRQTVVVVLGFSDALRIARQSDLTALVPRLCFDVVDPLSDGLSGFDLPIDTP